MIYGSDMAAETADIWHIRRKQIPKDHQEETPEIPIRTPRCFDRGRLCMAIRWLPNA